MIKLLVAFGTRPEAIKTLPIIRQIKKISDIELKILSTGQHADMLENVLQDSGIEVDYSLKVMKIGQTLGYLTVEILTRAEKVLDELLPDFVFVHGDTTTAFAVSLAAFYKKIPVIHIEAGLRTYDKYNPYPEEFNRCAVAKLASYHFSPTEANRKNLIREGINKDRIFVVGNSVIDALRENLSEEYRHKDLPSGRFILLTAHRRENLGEGMKNIFSAVRKICESFKEYSVIYPIHANELIKKEAYKAFSGVEGVKIIPSLKPLDFHNFLYRCSFAITDSGGVQEEASYLGKAVITARKATERKELLSKSGVIVTGADEKKIFNVAKKLIENKRFYKKHSKRTRVLGDGSSSELISKILLNILYPIEKS